MIRVLWSGIDTWEESFRGDLEAETVHALAERKQRAQIDELAAPWELGGRKFGVEPAGQRPWRFLLKDEDMLLRLYSLSSAPTLSGRLRPLGLIARGARVLRNDLVAVAASLGLDSIGVSRVDIAVDFQGWTPTVKDMENVVCSASYRPILPNLEHPETFYFGKGDLVVRIYNKSREIVKHKKEWIRELWLKSPDYEPDEDVWRFELQLRRPVLRQLGCEYATSVLEGLGGLLGFALDWCNLRVPDGENTARWVEDPKWTELRRASCASEPLKRVKLERRLGAYSRSARMVFSYMLSVCAWLGIRDFDQGWDLLRRQMRDYIGETEKSFSTLVDERERRAVSTA